jgi:hypothetical protein
MAEAKNSVFVFKVALKYQYVPPNDRAAQPQARMNAMQATAVGRQAPTNDR